MKMYPKPKYCNMAIPKGKEPYPKVRQIINDDETFGIVTLVEIQYSQEANIFKYFIPWNKKAEIDWAMAQPSRSPIIKMVKEFCTKVFILNKDGKYLRRILNERKPNGEEPKNSDE